MSVGAALPLENKLVLIDPAGNVIVSYLKSHAVSGWEAGIMRRGDGRVPVIATGNGRIAAAICFDADFPEFIRQAGQGLADLLIVPANESPRGMWARPINDRSPVPTAMLKRVPVL